MYRVSVDVGGTFTDLVAMDEETGRIINIKVATEPKSPEGGVLLALRRFLEGRDPLSVGMVGHATTIATNALFGQIDLELPRTALVCYLFPAARYAAPRSPVAQRGQYRHVTPYRITSSNSPRPTSTISSKLNGFISRP